jgi:ribose transport system substrate-binding protein
MKNKLWIVFILIVVISPVSLYGCYNNKQTSSLEQRINIDFIVKMGGGQYWNSVYLGAHQAAKEFNVNMTFTAPGSEQDITRQEKLFSNALERNVNAIVISASDYKGMKDSVELANERKIPVITVDSGVASNKVVSRISTDNFEAGKMAGERLVSMLPKDATVAIINFVKGSESADKREDGILSVLEEHPTIKLASKQYSYSNEKLAYNLTKNMLLIHEKIDGIVALNSMASLGAAQAIEEMGLTGKVKLVAFDNTPLEIQYLEKGVIDAIVVQNPFAMGYLGVKHAAMAARGVKVDKEVNIESRIIDMDNIYTEENQKFMFPFTK